MKCSHGSHGLGSLPWAPQWSPAATAAWAAAAASAAARRAAAARGAPRPWPAGWTRARRFLWPGSDARCVFPHSLKVSQYSYFWGREEKYTSTVKAQEVWQVDVY